MLLPEHAHLPRRTGIRQPLSRSRYCGTLLVYHPQVMVGVERFELPTSWSQTKRSNLTDLHSEYSCPHRDFHNPLLSFWHTLCFYSGRIEYHRSLFHCVEISNSVTVRFSPSARWTQVSALVAANEIFSVFRLQFTVEPVQHCSCLCEAIQDLWSLTDWLPDRILSSSSTTYR